MSACKLEAIKQNGSGAEKIKSGASSNPSSPGDPNQELMGVREVGLLLV